MESPVSRARVDQLAGFFNLYFNSYFVYHQLFQVRARGFKKCWICRVCPLGKSKTDSNKNNIIKAASGLEVNFLLVLRRTFSKCTRIPLAVSIHCVE